MSLSSTRRGWSILSTLSPSISLNALITLGYLGILRALSTVGSTLGSLNTVRPSRASSIALSTVSSQSALRALSSLSVMSPLSTQGAISPLSTLGLLVLRALSTVTGTLGS